MGNIRNVILCLTACFAAVSLAAGDVNMFPGPSGSNPTNVTTTLKPDTTSISTPKTTPSPLTTTAKTTTAAPSPNTTTAKTTTLAPSPNTTTIKTTTAAPSPNTTTAKTTTAAPSPNTTTSATTTTARPTPTPAPPTPVDPKQGKWIANYTGSNKICIVLQVALQIDLLYKQPNATKKLVINLPTNATSVGNCTVNKTEQSIALQWTTAVNVTNSIVFNFERDNGTKNFDLKSIHGSLNVSIPGLGYQLLNWDHQKKDEFHTPVSKSYKCAKEQILNVTVTQKLNVTASLNVSHLQLEAFRNSGNDNFSEAIDCVDEGTPDVVPIAVGCALAALVIIVLVAYLIGRRRSQARGYLSMFTENKREEEYIPMKNLSCFN